jgi:DNA ligase (NAD+)
MKLAGVHHLEPMLSLDCTYLPGAVSAWIESVGCPIVAEPKLDGVAASVRYVDGQLESVATRGDGRVGRDITDRGSCLVPYTTRERGVFEVRGEIVLPMRVWHFHESQAAARNRVAHLVTRNDSRSLLQSGAVFVAYDFCGDCTEVPWGFLEPDATRFPCDGVVFKVTNRSDRTRLGSTRRAPRWAIAYKGAASAFRGLHDLAGIPLPSGLA